MIIQHCTIEDLRAATDRVRADRAAAGHSRGTLRALAGRVRRPL